MDLTPLFSTFLLITLTEIGDKTMIAVITQSCRHSRKSVFLGALAALGMVSAIGVLIGQAIFEVVSRQIIELIAGAIFIVAGITTLLMPEKKKESKWDCFRSCGGFLGTFILVTLMELGDKTQFSVIALSAESGAGYLVFIGALMGFALITLIEVLFGGELGKRVDKKYIKLASAIVFLIFGAAFILQALL